MSVLWVTKQKHEKNKLIINCTFVESPFFGQFYLILKKKKKFFNRDFFMITRSLEHYTIEFNAAVEMLS